MSLVLTRKVDEGVTMIVPPSDKPTEIHVGVVANPHPHRKNQTRLAFDADKGVRVVRDELISRDAEKGAA